MNVGIFEQRRSLADHVEIPRTVEHFAYFRRHPAAENARDALERDGYAVTLDRRFMKTALVATKESPVDLETSNDFTRHVAAAITAAGGDYDGWGAAVIR